MFNPVWTLDEIKQDKPVKVFTIFSCGGGSSMGYKRAGFQVLGNCEIDPRMNAAYVANNHPKYNYNMDVRDFLKQEDLPAELYDLDILDGSPPCSSFSTAGVREKAWGKKKVFKEGQKAQTLDDLFFVFLDVVEKLRPKVVIAENVVGLIAGNAKGYVNMIIKRFKELGYDVQIFKLNAAFMEVPQKRERVFFIANRMGFPKLKLDFNYKPIKFGEVRSKDSGREIGFVKSSKRHGTSCERGRHVIVPHNRRSKSRAFLTNSFVNIRKAFFGRFRQFQELFVACARRNFPAGDLRTIQTFPQDYNFINNNPNNIGYICGMSVPPNMMAHIATQVWNQWLKG